MIKRLLFLIALGVGGAWIVRHYVVEGVWVVTGSMEPTLPVGTHYFVNKLAYLWEQPLRGDIIVFPSPVNAEKGMIKRVIGVGGDQIELRSKQVFLNGSALSEPYAVYKRAGERLKGDSMDPLTIPAGHYFVMGDNRDESEDSTSWRDAQSDVPIRFITRSSIQGRLVRF